MAIPAGTRLGTYEVTSHIGSGGMGEVYQAHDSKLGRDVAVKVLPEQFARDPERLARFQREAKLLASLNHPNIATIHGLEQSGSTHFLVMELVLGETLREKIAGGRSRDTAEGGCATPVEEALTIAKQVAEALEAAHNSEKCIIHRDLKPANVKVTPEGRVKVLDFGLAKAFATDTASEDPSNSPTLSMNPTMHGVIMGTAAYMSPEQARGKKVTKATDIFAFGAVLYEMLTGKQAFQGEDVAEILAAVMKMEPDWSLLPAETPAAIQTLLRRCLRKDKRQRLQDATGIRIEIEEALAAPAGVSAPTAAPAVKGWRRILPWAAALVLTIMTGFAVWSLKPTPAPPPKPVTRFTITLPPGERLADGVNDQVVALSPDGSQLAYVAIRGGKQEIYLRAMEGLEAKPVPGTEGAALPIFSPDGQWLGFFAGGKLKKTPVNGGAAITLGDVAIPRGATWSSDGRIIFALAGTVSAIQQISDVGGAPQPLTHVAKGDVGQRWPESLPGGKALLFATTTDRNWENAQVAVQLLGTGERRNLIQGATKPRYALSGHLVYEQGGRLMAVPFDSQKLETIGTAVPAVEGVLYSTTSGAAQYSISSTGTLAYVPGGAQETQSQLVWVSRNGAEQLLAAPAHFYADPRVSPDGRRVAVAVQEQESQLWVYEISRDALARFTFEGSMNSTPAWTPDGKRIAFSSAGKGAQNAFWQMADGTGGSEQLTTGENSRIPFDWSPDGKLLVFMEVNPATGYDIWVLRISDHNAEPFVRTQFNEASPKFSPDGHWLAYTSDESGHYEVYVQPYPGPGGKRQISTEGGTEPVWNPKGRELFYRSGEKMMAVDVTTEPSFSAGKPHVLFSGQYVPSPLVIANYDVSSDGQRFLMLKPSEETSSLSQIVVVQNWFEELKRRVPTGK